MPRSNPVALGLIAIMGVVASTLAAQTTVILPGVKDNTLISEGAPNGTLSNGAGNGVYCGVTSTGNFRRALVKFDVSQIPANAVVTSASLTLNMSRTISAAVQCNAHRVLADWGEGTSSASGGGAPSTPNDATWVHRLFPATFWTTAGGDFVATASASKNVAGTGPYSFTGPGLDADVQSWVVNGATNFGWLIKTDETVTPSAKKFDSREATLAANRPKLTVTYTSAPTATVVSVGTGCHVTSALDLALTATGLPQTGNAAFALNVAHGVPGAQTWFYLAAGTATPTPATPTCNIYLDVPTALSLLTTGISPVGPFPLNGAGAFVLPAGLPNNPALWGQVIAVQVLSADAASPIGAVLSNALTLTFGV